jgi:signal transduction histidine kinase
VKRARSSRKARTDLPALRARLDEAEATLRAIRAGEVDALVVSGPGGDHTLALEGAAHPYHVLLNAMSDGAALLGHDGTILFCNRRFGEIARAPVDGLRGSRFQHHIAFADQPRFHELLRARPERGEPMEFAIACGDGTTTPVSIALSTVPLGAHTGGGGADEQSALVMMVIVTDLTELKRAEATHFGLMTRLISAEDEERRRIARELHDETGQSLTALLVGLRAIEHQEVLADVRSAAQRLRGIASRTVDEVGRLARGLHPSVLDDMGLAAAVTRHVRDYTEAIGVSVDLRMEEIGSEPLPPLVATTIYRVIQEALTNVARHARARTVGVELRREGTILELLVHDDGVGFDPGAVLSEASGLGLHGMQERVALLGGSAEIESTPGHGTSVRARIPSVSLPPATTRSRLRHEHTPGTGERVAD